MKSRTIELRSLQAGRRVRPARLLGLDDGPILAVRAVQAGLDAQGVRVAGECQPLELGAAASRGSAGRGETKPEQRGLGDGIRVVVQRDRRLRAAARVVAGSPGVRAADGHPLQHDQVVVHVVMTGRQLHDIARTVAGGAAIDLGVCVRGPDRLAQRALAIVIGRVFDRVVIVGRCCAAVDEGRRFLRLVDMDRGRRGRRRRAQRACQRDAERHPRTTKACDGARLNRRWHALWLLVASLLPSTAVSTGPCRSRATQANRAFSRPYLPDGRTLSSAGVPGRLAEEVTSFTFASPENE